MESQEHKNVGKMFAESIDIEVHRKGELYYACVTILERESPLALAVGVCQETDPYKNRDYALSEAKGYLEGLAIKLEAELNNIDMQLTKKRITIGLTGAR